MNPKHISLAFAAAATLLAGCAKSSFEEPIDGQFADLEVSYVGATETKAAIDGATFPADGKIGLFLFTDEVATTPYGESGYENVEYSYNSTKSRWTASPSIKVGSTPGYLYGYYPYSSAATDIKAIPVSSSLNGDDVMYASKQEAITDKTAGNTKITMNHALARVSITVKNNGYTGEAKLSHIKFEGAKLASSGTLNALEGKITATKADEVVISVPTAEQPIATGSGTTYECLLVPSEVISDRQTVSLTLTIDGEPKTATLSGNDNGVIFAQGIQSNITITLSNSGISVQTVSVENWNVVEVAGHKVTIKMAEDVTAGDIMYGAYVDGDDVIIRASSYSGQHLKCTMPDGEFCTSQSKTDKLAYTFTISDITENTTANIGYAPPVSIDVSPEKSGTILVEGESYVGKLYEGETVTLTAKPGEGYAFVRWQDQNGTILCENEDYNCRFSSKVNVTAVFQQICSLKVFVSPSFAGSVSAFENYNVKGTEITLTTTPSGNSVFNGWKDKDGNILSDKSTYTFTIESDMIIIAYYSVDYGSDALNGVFTVAEDNGYGKPKMVRFSKGNLWASNVTTVNPKFNFEDNQWEFNITSEGNLDKGHISHFYWSQTAYEASNYRKYSDPHASKDDIFFPNSANFAVNGVSTWHTLSQTEWAYLFGGSEKRDGKYQIVTVNGIKGLVIAPDGFKGTIENTYTDSEWATAESNYNLVFLPAAGWRDGRDDIHNMKLLDVGNGGYYWSASPQRATMAYFTWFCNYVKPDSNIRGCGYSVRLVTEVTE